MYIHTDRLYMGRTSGRPAAIYVVCLTCLIRKEGGSDGSKNTLNRRRNEYAHMVCRWRCMQSDAGGPLQSTGLYISCPIRKVYFSARLRGTRSGRMNGHSHIIRTPLAAGLPTKLQRGECEYTQPLYSNSTCIVQADEATGYKIHALSNCLTRVWLPTILRNSTTFLPYVR
jgi:hypothetical protein